MFLRNALLLMLLVAGPAKADLDPQHAGFSTLLRAHVADGRVDYAALQRDRAPLDRYIAQLGAVDAAALKALSREEQLAYWLNAYNAFVLRTIIDHYPISRGSLVGLGFPANSIWQISGAFKEARFDAGGRRVSLDDIEHKIIRPTYKDPRVHMALVCAAHSCPALRAEPYVGARLDTQLDDQSQRFAADATRGLHIDEGERELRISTIFKWFAEDFASLGGGDEAAGVREFLASNTPDAARAARIRSAQLKLRYLDYDWTLNDR